MTPTLLPALVGLALLDSVSIGTLAIPLALALQERTRLLHVVFYLATIAIFYIAVGIALLTVASGLRSLDLSVFDGPAVDIAQIAVAVALLALSEYLTPAKRAARAEANPDRVGALGRWRQRVFDEQARVGLVVGLAVVAATIELASMLPYLAAIGIIATNGVELPMAVALLVGYTTVMIAPAVVLVGLRYALGARVQGPLRAMNSWVATHSASAVSWVVGIVAVLLFLDGVSRLFSR